MLSITKISDKHILKGVGFCKRITAVVLKGSWLFVVIYSFFEERNKEGFVLLLFKKKRTEENSPLTKPLPTWRET